MGKKTIRAAAALVALALTAAACSSGSSSSSPTTGSKLTGSPIVIGQILPMTGAALQLPQMNETLVAAVNYYNAHGGLFGHPLKVDLCDSQDSATSEVACAQKLVNDHVVANVGDDLTFNEAASQDALTAANIARIGPIRGSVGEYQAKTNYDFTPGTILGVAALAVDAVLNGCTKVSVVTVDGAAAGQLPALISPILAQAGGTLVNTVLVSGTATDYTPYLQSAEANGACSAAIALGTAQANGFMQAYNQVKPNLKLVLPTATYASNDLSKLGEAAKVAAYTYGVPGANDPGVPGLKNVANILAGGGSSITPNTLEGNGTLALLGMVAFMQAMQQYKPMLASTTTISNTDVISAMNSAKNINLWGIVPNWTPSQSISLGPTFGSFFENVSNPYEYNSHWSGHFTNSGTFNIAKYIPGAPAAG